MQQQRTEPLIFTAQPQRIVRKSQQLILGVVWMMAPFMLLSSYLRYGEIRTSSILGVAIPIILTGVMAAFRPKQIAESMPQPTLVADEQGLRLEGGVREMSPIPWSEIVALRPLTVLGFDTVHIVLHDVAKLKKTLGFYWYNNRWPGGIALPIIAFGPGRDVVAKLVAYRSEKGL